MVSFTPVSMSDFKRKKKNQLPILVLLKLPVATSRSWAACVI